MKTIDRGPHSGLAKPVQKVIRTPEEWERLWQNRSDIKQPPEPAPSVDFDQNMIIALAAGRKPTGGYSIEIIDVHRQSDHLRVRYREKAPPKGAMTIQVLTTPFHFVAVPTSDLEVRFVEASPEASQGEKSTK